MNTGTTNTETTNTGTTNTETTNTGTTNNGTTNNGTTNTGTTNTGTTNNGTTNTGTTNNGTTNTGTTNTGTTNTGLGSTCNTHTSCDGYILAKAGTLACCNGKCTKQQTDWAGKGQCPDQCMDAPAPLDKPKSCGSGNSWRRRENQPCDEHKSCDGYKLGKPGTLACCGRQCRKQLKNYIGIGTCPAACQKKFMGPAGTCDYNI